MKGSCANRSLLAGAVAGLAGTASLMAMRRFDQIYAPRTIPKTSQDPGEFIVEQAEQAAHVGRASPSRGKRAAMEKGAAMALQIGYGIVPGFLYALLRGRQRRGSSLVDGAAIGAAVYLLGYLGWLPMARLTRPLWKQPLPEIVGETMRHVAYGVTTAATYGAIKALRYSMILLALAALPPI